MGLGFLVPAFLIGLTVLAVPVILHLRQREQRERVRFPSLMFLARITHRTTDKRRITNRLLLALRALATTALVLAFARPFVERAPADVVAARRGAVIVLIDRSLSMGYAGVWQRAVDSARTALGGVGPGDRTALIAFDEVAVLESPLGEDPAAPLARLAALAPGARGTRLAPAFRAARDVAMGAPDSRIELVLVSDLQKHALEGLEAVDAISGATLRVVNVGAAAPANARVASVSLDRALVGRQAELRVSARVASQGFAEPRPIAARLVVNGRELATTRDIVPATGVATLTFPAVRSPDGVVAGSVELESDDLPADDLHRFALSAGAGVRVLLLLPPGAAAADVLYLERALAISRSPVLLVESRRGALTSRDLSQVAVVVAADVAALGSSAAALAGFVERGGGVVAFAGARAGGSGPERAWLPARVGDVVDRTRDRGGTLGWVERAHPVFEPFREGVASDFGAARFYRYRALAPDSLATTLARFDDGRAALLERRHGNGRVLIAAAPADAHWSDLPLQPVFLPLVQRLVAYAGNLTDDRTSWQAGDVATLPDSRDDLVVRAPDGEVTRVTSDSGARVFPVASPGFYEIRAADRTEPVLATMAVNPPARESDLAAAEPGDVTALLRVPPPGAAALPAEGLTAREQEAQQRWWIWLLAGALGLLAFESWYAARLSSGAVAKGGLR